ncbi:hypothetical protein ACIQW5_27040 [Methylorubrum thiocyanatum]|uniref:hypothetical protein n=1 Tax=Methylorubrum thiocyanatum TaxID=47958 RepID=UPI00383AAB71
MADVLKSFVLSLSARVDHAAFQNFEASIGRTTRTVAALGVAVQSAFLSINVWAAKVSGGFDQLYYSSQRMGASAANIKALSYGLSQMGSNASAANSSMENFARTLRNNRGYYEVLERLGIRTRNAQGIRRDATELMQEFGRALRSQSQEAKHLYLEMFGIDDATGRALIQGVDKFTTEYRDRLRKAGLDPDKAAADANALQTTFRSIGSSLEVLGAKIASRLFSEQNNAFKRFMEFIDTNGDKIAGIVSKLAQVALQLAEAFIRLATDERTQKFLDTLLGSLGKVDEKTGEFTADVEKLKTALEVFAAFVVGTWLTKLLGAFGLLGRGWGGLLRTLGLPAIAGLAASGGGHMTPEEYKSALDSDPARRKADEELNKRGGAGKRYFGDLFSPKAGDNRSFMERMLPKSLGGKDAPAGADSTGEGAANPEASKALGDAIARAEGTYKGGYDTVLGYGKWGTPSKPLSQMTMDEVYEFGMQMRRAQFATGQYSRFSDTSSASGRYQIVGSTMRDAMKALGLKGSDLFNPENQDRMMRWIARRQGLGAWEGLKLGRNADQLEKARAAVAAGGTQDETAAQSRARKAPKLTADDILPGGLKGAINGNMPGTMQPSAPPVSGSQSSLSITVNQGPISVAGMDDGKRVADRIGEVQGYRTSDLVRNLRRSVA